jgi:hypothetical protein
MSRNTTIVVLFLAALLEAGGDAVIANYIPCLLSLTVVSISTNIQWLGNV